MSVTARGRPRVVAGREHGSGICRSCGSDCALLSDGRIIGHRSGEISGGGSPFLALCPGSGHFPETTTAKRDASKPRRHSRALHIRLLPEHEELIRG